MGNDLSRFDCNIMAFLWFYRLPTASRGLHESPADGGQSGFNSSGEAPVIYITIY